ncbi:hypothetical protein [Bradyrhizobium sp. 186]|uniref:ATP-binding protein n=1 Tax=Bradyrhizobium sp. 186 TaxID=2782654 RepID=UPI002001ABCF|nr:hypothetical protein [Bradyrhizobium sp. 186]
MGGNKICQSAIEISARPRRCSGLWIARRALLERRSSEPIPFIGDDLFSSFDESRSSAMLRLLVAAGQQQQIILFTHHRYVVDLARSINERLIEVIDL